MSWIRIRISQYGSGSEFYNTDPDPHHWFGGNWEGYAFESCYSFNQSSNTIVKSQNVYSKILIILFFLEKDKKKLFTLCGDSFVAHQTEQWIRV